MPTISNCNGKLRTDLTGKIVCDIDKVNDADNSSNNEIQNLSSVLSVGNDAGGQRITNISNPVDDNDVATKKYVDNYVNNKVVFEKVSSPSYLNYYDAWNYCLSKGFRLPSVSEVDYYKFSDPLNFNLTFTGNFGFWTSDSYSYGKSNYNAYHPERIGIDGEKGIYCSVERSYNTSSCQHVNAPMKVVCVK